MIRRAALACLLVATAATAEDKVESAWFVPLSLVALEGDQARVTATASGPTVNLHTQSAYGIAAGLGYRAKSGVQFSVSLLHVQQSVSASWNTPNPGTLSYDSDRTGAVFSVNIPLGGK